MACIMQNVRALNTGCLVSNIIGKRVILLRTDKSKALRIVASNMSR